MEARDKTGETLNDNELLVHRSFDVKEKIFKELANLENSLNPIATFCLAYLTTVCS
jgi:hypothetical protein